MEAMGEDELIMVAFALRDSRRMGGILRQRDLGVALFIVAVLKPRPNATDGALIGSG
jgi:hypothetical protein